MPLPSVALQRIAARGAGGSIGVHRLCSRPFAFLCVNIGMSTSSVVPSYN